MENPRESSRPQRVKSDKTGRLLALQRLKELKKGCKNKYAVEEVDNVYEEVDEQEYSQIVLDRQTDDWIVDDGQSGYVEDGREIFDDDLDSESVKKARGAKLVGPRKKKKEEVKKRGNIQNMLMKMPTKKIDKEVNLQDDDLLGNLMLELQSKDSSPKPPRKVNKFAVNHGHSISNKKDEDDDMSIFDPPKRVETFIPPSHANVSRRSNEQSNSQVIVNDISEDESLMDVDLGTESTSQIIEDTQDTLNQYVGDLSTVSFDNFEEPTTSKEKLEPPTCKKSMETETIDSELFNSEWTHEFETQSSFKLPTTIPKNDAELPLPLTTNSENEQVFRFYWWDAYEDVFRQSGIVYLLGKVFIPSLKDYRSCCLTVKNIPRRIYLLPREYIKGSTEENSMDNVYSEFNEFANKSGIKEFRCKKIEKLYAFEKEGIPKTSQYLEVRYSASYPSMSSDYNGRSVEGVFGTSANALELLLIERKIKGPCWLDIKCPLSSELSNTWSPIKIDCMKMENVSVTLDSHKLPIPPLTIATLNVRMSLNSKTHQNEVIMITILLNHKYHIDKEAPKQIFQQSYCLLTSPKGTYWPKQSREMLSRIKYAQVIQYESEYDLLEQFLKILSEVDPDLIVGYDCAFQLDVLMHRMGNLKIPNWSRIGKLKRSSIPSFKGKIMLHQIFAGRPICDIQVSAKELNLKVRSYDLQSLCVAILNKDENQCREIKPSECAAFYANVEKLENLIKFNLEEARNILTIMFDLNIMPLALQITCLAGNILSRTLSAGRAERNEYLLLHAFHNKNYIVPDKRNAKKEKNEKRKKAAYAGGLVLEPKKGFYDKLILLMDFNSLYPSIIQEYNLCFTTVPGAAFADNEDLTIPGPDVEPGVVPTEIRKLVESRVEVKKLMNAPQISSELKMQYNTRQLALKLTANSMYGCLGATHCRFYAKGLAALITFKGREILQNTKSLVEKLNYEVIYGDTDSLMINTNILEYDEVFTIGKKIKQEVNRLYKKIELDIDGVFRYLLLLQKKKYAAVIMTKLPNNEIKLKQEHKGLDIVRRDWCQLACGVGEKILEELLSDKSSENRIEQIFTILQNISKSIREDLIPLKSYVITKQLSKNPNEYPNKKQAHVMVALRMNKLGGRMWKSGDTMAYIICEDGTDSSAIERAYHIEEFKKSDKLKIDKNYYLLNQIFPIVLRICEPIEGLDDILLAEYLDIKQFYKSKRIIHEEGENDVPLIVDHERFRYCLPLKVKCKNQNCGETISIDNIVRDTINGPQLSLASCSNPDCDFPPWKYANAIQNAIKLAIRNSINEYYNGWMECENPLCSARTRRLPLTFYGKYPKCEKCKNATDMHRVYSEMKMYNQICFYLHLFDINPVNHKKLLPKDSRGMINAYETIKESIEEQLRRSAYSIVDLKLVFSSLLNSSREFPSTELTNC